MRQCVLGRLTDDQILVFVIFDVVVHGTPHKCSKNYVLRFMKVSVEFQIYSLPFYIDFKQMLGLYPFLICLNRPNTLVPMCLQKKSVLLQQIVQDPRRVPQEA